MADRDERAIVESILGEHARVGITRFSSGAISLDIWIGDEFIVVQSFPSQGDVWGVSVDVNASNGLLGHDQHFPSLEEALQAAHTVLVGRAAAPDD